MYFKKYTSSSFHSLYTYDPSGLYLVAVTIGNLTTAYSYNDKGDLANILYSTGNRKVFEYDETNLLCAVKSYSNTSSELFSITRTNNWNGNVLLTIQPRNTSTEITYDTAGRIASYSTNGGMALVELINSSGRLIYFGGEVMLFRHLIISGFHFSYFLQLSVVNIAPVLRRWILASH